jgi:hypothetical protein
MGADHGNIDSGSGAINREIQHAQRHNRIIAFFFGAAVGVDKRRRDKLDLSGRDTIKIR